MADPLRPFCWGVLHAIGMFDPADLPADPAGDRTWFGLGEAVMAGLLASIIAIPAGAYFAGLTELPPAFIGAGVIFLPLFVFVPKLIRLAMKADTDMIIAAFGKNEQVKKVFWAVFAAVAGLVLANIADPATAQQIVAIITGT